jgi:hypothetical protein
MVSGAKLELPPKLEVRDEPYMGKGEKLPVPREAEYIY